MKPITIEWIEEYILGVANGSGLSDVAVRRLTRAESPTGESGFEVSAVVAGSLHALFVPAADVLDGAVLRYVVDRFLAPCFTTLEVARFCRCSQRTVQRHIRRGALRAEGTPRGRNVALDALVEAACRDGAHMLPGVTAMLRRYVARREEGRA